MMQTKTIRRPKKTTNKNNNNKTARQRIDFSLVGEYLILAIA
jgi:hypothetical protein